MVIFTRESERERDREKKPYATKERNTAIRYHHHRSYPDAARHMNYTTTNPLFVALMNLRVRGYGNSARVHVPSTDFKS